MGAVPGVAPLSSVPASFHWLLLVAFLSLGSCATPITTESIRASGAPLEQREKALSLLEEAVFMANDFLGSAECRTLPGGSYESDQLGELSYVTPVGTWATHIENSCGGDLAVWIGFRAQERDDGFVVGSRPPDRFAEIDNSMFRTTDGSWQSAESITRLILHETAHTIHGEGTVGVWNSIAYYAEAIFLLRASYHSAEEIPRAVEEEFMYHRHIEAARAAADEERLQSYLEAFEEHLSAGAEHCAHGRRL
jgi:hypothetical protein